MMEDLDMTFNELRSAASDLDVDVEGTPDKEELVDAFESQLREPVERLQEWNQEQNDQDEDDSDDE